MGALYLEKDYMVYFSSAGENMFLGKADCIKNNIFSGFLYCITLHLLNQSYFYYETPSEKN